MAKTPAFQFYTGDWLKDPQLGMCGSATRGIWMDLLCAMHENDRSGQITGTIDQLCRVCRCTAVEINAALRELQDTKTADVTFRDGNVTVTCRRMKREAKERNAARERKQRSRSRGQPDDVTEKSRSYSSSSSSSSDKPPPPCDKGRGSKTVTGVDFSRLKFPDSLPPEETIPHLEKWAKYRGAAVKTNLVFQEILNRFADKSPEELGRAISYSISQGWKGMFQEGASKGGGSDRSNPAQY